MSGFTFEQLKRRSFERVAWVLKHFFDEQKDEFRGEARLHSRIFDTLIFDEYINLGESEELKNTGGSRHREHLVPCAYIRDLAFKMYLAGKQESEVADMIQKCLKIAFITAEEAKRLDKVHKSTMPADWDWRSGSVLWRLENDGNIRLA